MNSITLVSSKPQISLPKFNLAYIVDQISSDPAYADWTPQRIRDAVEEYRRFLALCRALPNENLGIGPDADRVWHRHILNTRRYAADCLSYFGYYFHHTPVSTAEENTAAQHRTNELLLKFFGINRLPHGTLTCVGSGCMNNG